MVTLRLEIPRKMREAAQAPGIENTPYDICFACPFKNETCAGGNECAVDMSRLIDLWNQEAKLHRITRADAVEKSGIPITTVNNIMTKRTLDPRFSTVAALSKAYNRRKSVLPPCHLAALLMQDKLPEGDEPDEGERINALKEEISRLKENEKTVFDRAERQAQREVDHLTRLANQQETRILKHEGQISNLWTALSISLCVSAVFTLVIVAALAVDYSNNDVGFFFIDGHFSPMGIFLAAAVIITLVVSVLIAARSRRKQ